MNFLTNSFKVSFLSRFLTGTGGCLLVLVLQNILIFWQHYSGTASFLNDFTRIFYPMTAFWVTLVQHGIFPEWVSFQNMGFPFALSMQSGIFYPPLWLFALFKLPYTLHSAAIVQILHVLWGAVGCWVYMRLLGRSRGSALFAAVAFQLFGGFYSNSEHVDIVRAFSYIPWIFWVIHVTPMQGGLEKRNWLAPLIILLFITSAYQGNLVSHLFMLSVFWMLSWLSHAVAKKQRWQSVATLHLQIAALGILGLALCSVYLFPTLALKSMLARDGVWVGPTMNWPLSYWNTLIMPSDAEGRYILQSMLSAFVTVPVFCLLFFISSDLVKKNALWMCITFFAFVMASGTHFFVYPWIVNSIPQLGSSRFPSSDYRGIVGFGLILLASGVLDEYLSGKTTQKIIRRFVWCLSLSALMFLLGNTVSAEKSEWTVAMILLSLFFLTLYFFRQKLAKALLVIIAWEMISGFYFVRQASVLWSTDVASNDFHQSIARESAYSMLDGVNHPPESRPACQDMNLFSASSRGYLLGNYMCQTQDSKTKPREIVNANPAINVFMRQVWQARVMQKEQLAVCQPDAALQANTQVAPITSVSYGLQQVIYQVNASDDFCFIENELLFPGWSGVLADSSTAIKPQAYCGALRSWCLPKGDYQFTARYRSPGLREGAMASVVFFLMYALVVWRFVLNKKTDAAEKTISAQHR